MDTDTTYEKAVPKDPVINHSRKFLPLLPANLCVSVSICGFTSMISCFFVFFVAKNSG